MSIKERINADLKRAMLAGDKTLVETLRGLKSAIQYAEVAAGTQGQDDDAAVQVVLSKEAKKRQESADLYHQGGNEERAKAELTERSVIEEYLPEQMSEDDVAKIVDEVIGQLSYQKQEKESLLREDAPRGLQMGQVIGKVRERTKGQADGSTIARLVKERLS